METYGILGNCDGNPKVIRTSLDDIGTNVHYILPHYKGQVHEALEAVYDWVLENDAEFTIISNARVPKVLREAAMDFINEAESVNDEVIQRLSTSEVKGLACILWDKDHEDFSKKVAQACIQNGLPTLELTNGMVPIILSDVDSDLAEIEQDFSREELEGMPAATVKRLAKGKGFDVKTKEEALNALSPQEEDDEEEIPAAAEERWIVKVTVEYSDGTVQIL